MKIWKPLWLLFWFFLLQKLSIQISYHKLEDPQMVCKELKNQSSRIQTLTIDHENHQLHLILNDYLYIYEIDDAIYEREIKDDENFNFTLNLDKPLEKMLWHEHDRYKLPNRQETEERSLSIYNIFNSIHHYLFTDGTKEYVKNVQNFPNGPFRVITDGRASKSTGYLIRKPLCTSVNKPRLCILWNNLDFQDYDKLPYANNKVLKTRLGYYFRVYITPVETYELMHDDQPLLSEIPMGFIYQQTVHVLYPPDQKVFIFLYQRLAPNMKRMGSKTRPFTVISFDDYLNCSSENIQTPTPTSRSILEKSKFFQFKEIILIALGCIAISLVTCIAVISCKCRSNFKCRAISATSKFTFKKKKRCNKYKSFSSDSMSLRESGTFSSRSSKQTFTMTETSLSDSKTELGKHSSGHVHHRRTRHHRHHGHHGHRGHHGNQKIKDLIKFTKTKSEKVFSKLVAPPSIYPSSLDTNTDGQNQKSKIFEKVD